MGDRPIIFSAPMVRALLEGRKTMTRRLAWQKPQIAIQIGDGPIEPIMVPTIWQKVRAGDRLYVREAHAFIPRTAYGQSMRIDHPDDADTAAIFLAGWDRSTSGIRWRPSIHMPRWASRITLAVTGSRVEPLQEITSADAMAEGIRPYASCATIDCDTPDPRDDFRALWNTLHGSSAWDMNPEVVVISFTVRRGNIDELANAPAAEQTNG